MRQKTVEKNITLMFDLLIPYMYMHPAPTNTYAHPHNAT